MFKPQIIASIVLISFSSIVSALELSPSSTTSEASLDASTNNTDTSAKSMIAPPIEAPTHKAMSSEDFQAAVQAKSAAAQSALAAQAEALLPAKNQDGSPTVSGAPSSHPALAPSTAKKQSAPSSSTTKSANTNSAPYTGYSGSQNTNGSKKSDTNLHITY
jgi:hypothetical protein